MIVAFCPRAEGPAPDLLDTLRQLVALCSHGFQAILRIVADEDDSALLPAKLVKHSIARVSLVPATGEGGCFHGLHHLHCRWNFGNISPSPCVSSGGKDYQQPKNIWKKIDQYDEPSRIVIFSFDNRHLKAIFV